MRLARVLRRWLGGPDRAAPVEVPGDSARVAAVRAVLGDLEHLLAADGGAVDLLEVTDDGWVRLRFRGACDTCAAQPLTLRGALEPELRRRCAPWLRGVRVE